VRQLSFNVSIENDAIPEDDEDFTARLTLLPADQARLRSRVTVRPDLATVTILDDDGTLPVIDNFNTYLENYKCAFQTERLPAFQGPYS